MFSFDLQLWVFALAALLCAVGAWAIAAWLVERRVDDAFDRELGAARRDASRRAEEDTADPLRRD